MADHNNVDKGFVTVREFESAIARIERTLREGLQDVRFAVKESEEGWRSRAHQLSEDIQTQMLDVGLIKIGLERDKHERETTARYLWIKLGIAIPMIVGLATWIADHLWHIGGRP